MTTALRFTFSTYLLKPAYRHLGHYTAEGITEDDAWARAREMSAEDNGVSPDAVVTSYRGPCEHCGTAPHEAWNQRGGELRCIVCGANGDGAREIESLPGEQWALLRPGTGCWLVKSLFCGSEAHARSLVRGRQILVPAGDLAVGDVVTADLGSTVARTRVS